MIPVLCAFVAHAGGSRICRARTRKPVLRTEGAERGACITGAFLVHTHAAVQGREGSKEKGIKHQSRGTSPSSNVGFFIAPGPWPVYLFPKKIYGVDTRPCLWRSVFGRLVAAIEHRPLTAGGTQ